MRTITIFILLAALQLFAVDWQEFTLATQLPQSIIQDETEAPSTSVMVKGQKNPQAAFFMSAIIPGSGQVYAHSYLKGAAFIAVEAAAWTMYSAKKKAGDDKRTEFRTYATQHWSENEYWHWISAHSGIAYSGSGAPSDDLRAWEKQNFSHGLHADKDQQYYEMIGKYHQFQWGWEDYREGRDVSITHEQMTQEFEDADIMSAMRYHYESMRDDHNNLLKMATTFSTVAMVNHILSAVDAIWTTKRYNYKQSLTLRVEPMQYGTEIETALTLRMNW